MPSFRSVDVAGASYAYISVNGVDAAGEDVGNYGDVDGDGDGEFHGFIDNGGAVTFDPPTSSNTAVGGITSSGEIFGNYVDNKNQHHGFIDIGGVVTTVDMFLASSTSISGVSDTGEIFGDYVSGTGDLRGFFGTLGNFTMVDVAGAASTTVSGVDTAGALVGTYTDMSSRAHGFVKSNGVTSTIDPSGSTSTSIVGISDGGEIAGNYADGTGHEHGFTDIGGNVATIAIAGATSTLVSYISAAGEVVGTYTDGDGNVHGFLVEDGQTTTIDVSGAFETDLLGVGPSGELYGSFNDNTGQHGFVESLSPPPPPPPPPSKHVADDFDGSGTSDILFRNDASATTYLWEMSDTTVTGMGPTSIQNNANWQVVGLGDFSGDGKTDILWEYHNAGNPADGTNGLVYITAQDGLAATAGTGPVEQLDPQWSVAGTGDFNGDGTADILWRSSTTGQTYLDIMHGTALGAGTGPTSLQVADPSWKVAGIGDFDGNGTADILWRYDNAANAGDPNNGTIYEWNMSGAGVTSQGPLNVQPGSDKWNVAGIGDFDGNGTDDILFRYDNAANAADPLNGLTYVDFMNGQTVSYGAATQWQVDESWQVAGVDDFSGDGKADILFQHPSDGTTYIWNMNGAQVASGGPTSVQAGTGWTVENGKVA